MFEIYIVAVQKESIFLNNIYTTILRQDLTHLVYYIIGAFVLNDFCMVETNSPIYDYKYYYYGWVLNKCKFSDRLKLLSLLFFLVSQAVVMIIVRSECVHVGVCEYNYEWL